MVTLMVEDAEVDTATAEEVAVMVDTRTEMAVDIRVVAMG